MNCRQAAEAARTIRPQIAIPWHYGSVVESEDDAHTFTELVGERALILPVTD